MDLGETVECFAKFEMKNRQRYEQTHNGVSRDRTWGSWGVDLTREKAATTTNPFKVDSPSKLTRA